MNKKLDNLITEIASMIESGTIKVGALGLSKNSADYVNHYDDILAQEKKPRFMFSVLSEDEFGQTLQTFKTKKHAEEFYNALNE